MRPYSSRTDRSGLWFILTVICSFAFTGVGIWAIVEFLMYLVKDNPFNYTSLWLTIAFFVLELVFFLKLFFSSD